MGMVAKNGATPQKLKTKAAEGRHLLPCIVWLLQHIFPQETAHQQLRYQCAKHSLDMYQTLVAEPFDPKACATSGRKHVQLWSELGIESIKAGQHLGRGWVLYRFYPKHHLFLHTIEDQVLVAGNPRESWCYMDESAIGDAVHVAESLHALALHKSLISMHRC